MKNVIDVESTSNHFDSPSNGRRSSTARLLGPKNLTRTFVSFLIEMEVWEFTFEVTFMNIQMINFEYMGHNRFNLLEDKK